MRRRVFVIAVCLLFPPRVLASADQLQKLVKFTVIDVVTKKPVTEFSYSVSVIVPGEVDRRRPPAKLAPVEVKSPFGTFSVNAPLSCKIELDIDSPDAVYGFQLNETPLFHVFSNDTKREFVVRVKVGMTVRGVVREAKTGRPIPGATVAPIIDMHQARGPHMERALRTDADGRFQLRGVNPEWGALVMHPEHKTHYIPCKGPKAKQRGEHLIDLHVGQKETIRGIVRDDESQPVPGALISGWDQTTTSGKDGRFALIIPPPDYTHGEIRITKPDYGDAEVDIQLPVSDALAVTLIRQFVVEGTVRSSDGRPVSSFTIAAGPKLEPNHYGRATKEVREPSGQFSVSVNDAGLNRVVVKADGYAVWEGPVSVARKTAPMAIQLRPGFKLSGRVSRPSASRSRLEATLIPNPKPLFELVTPEAGRDLATQRVEIAEDGKFEFAHVRPDGYQLRIQGKDITPFCKLIEVENRDVHLGILSLNGTGRIVGTLHRAGGLDEAAWPFATVDLTFAPPAAIRRVFENERPCVTGEDGRFTFDNVPEGTNLLEVLDIRQGYYQTPYTWVVQVIAGKATEVRTFDRTKNTRLELSIVVGDGSRRDFEIASANRKSDEVILAFLGRDPTFALEVSPMSNQVSSFSVLTNPGNLSDRHRIRLTDVSAGAYRFQLLDPPEYVGAATSLLYEGKTLVKPGAPPVRIALESASIEGKVEGGEHGTIIAIDNGSKRSPRRAEYSGDGSFRIRFVRKGAYSLIAHDTRRGWGGSPRFHVGSEIAKPAPIKLVPGGEIRGRVVARTLCPFPDAVVAVDGEGIEIADEQFDQSELMLYRIPHLWPGEWTVRLMANGETLTSNRVKISQVETVTSDLVVDERTR
jgi:hypothetical protein